MHDPGIQLQRLSEECQKLHRKVHTSGPSPSFVVQIPEFQQDEEGVISDPEINPPAQVLLSRNGVGKTTIVNHELMLGEVGVRRASHVLAANIPCLTQLVSQQLSCSWFSAAAPSNVCDTLQVVKDVSFSREKAPKRYQQTEQGKVLVPVSEAVAEVLQEEELLCSTTGHIQFVCNPAPDANKDQQKQEDDRLTTFVIRDFVHEGPPEAHIQHRSFLLKTGCHAGTTTNSTLRIQFGHIPGAIERFKSKQQLQSAAFEYLQLKRSSNPDQQQLRKLYEQYKLITGLTACADDPLPETVSQVPICKIVAEVAGKIRLYSGQYSAFNAICCLNGIFLVLLHLLLAMILANHDMTGHMVECRSFRIHPQFSVVLERQVDSQ